MGSSADKRGLKPAKGGTVTALLLLWCQLYRVDETWVERQASSLLHHDPQQAKTAIEGTLLTINAKGLVLQNQDALFWWQNGKLNPLPIPGEKPAWILLHAPLLLSPALLSEQHLLLRDPSSWRVHPSLLHREWDAPSPRGNGSFGQTLTAPLLAQLGRTFLAYQPRSGEGWLSEEGAVQSFNTDRHLFPVAVSGHWAWLGRDDGSLAMCPVAQPAKVVRKIKIPYLSKSSSVLQTEDTLWFICFAQGLQAALGAWESQSIELHITWLKRDSLQTGTLRLPSAPLVFSLQASSSGSPKLQASPGFQSLIGCGSEALFLGWQKQGFLLQPGLAPQPFPQATQIRALTRSAGTWYALHHEWQRLDLR